MAVSGSSFAQSISINKNGNKGNGNGKGKNKKDDDPDTENQYDDDFIDDDENGDDGNDNGFVDEEVLLDDGSEDNNDFDTKWIFDRELDGIAIRWQIVEREINEYEFNSVIKNVDMSGTVSPISLMLKIRDENSWKSIVELNGQLSSTIDGDLNGSDDEDGDGVTVNDECPDSDIADTVIIDGCDTGVTNEVMSDGCTITDMIQICADTANNHGQFARCVSLFSNKLKKDGIINTNEKGAIQSCAAMSDRP